MPLAETVTLALPLFPVFEQTIKFLSHVPAHIAPLLDTLTKSVLSEE
jgi:hypothetical protein